MRITLRGFVSKTLFEPKKPKITSKTILNDETVKRINDKLPVGSYYFSVDYKNSFGNYIRDSQQNDILDMYTQIASIPLGYNNKYLNEIATDKRMIHYLINRPALGILPPSDLSSLLDDSVLKICPQGLDSVVTMMCGSCSVENAIKAAFFNYYEKRLGKVDFSPEELQTCMLNKPPGCPDLSILSFDGGFHGRTLGSLSLTRSKPIHKIGIPLFDWPMAKFPEMRYPMDAIENQDYNHRIVNKSLSEVRDKIREYQEKGRPVAGIIVEPIQCEGGDRFAPAYFFQHLQTICKENQISFIVDEVQTGAGTTGTHWYHETWNLPKPPDFVTFSKRMQTGGFYLKRANMTKKPFRIFNTWMGEPSKLYLLKRILEYIEKKHILQNVQTTGSYLVEELTSISKSNSKIRNVRGAGFIIGFDVGNDPTHKDKLWKILLDNGILTGVCGTNTLRLRPHLIFKKEHAEIFLGIMEKSLREL